MFCQHNTTPHTQRRDRPRAKRWKFIINKRVCVRDRVQHLCGSSPLRARAQNARNTPSSHHHRTIIITPATATQNPIWSWMCQAACQRTRFVYLNVCLCVPHLYIKRELFVLEQRKLVHIVHGTVHYIIRYIHIMYSSRVHRRRCRRRRDLMHGGAIVLHSAASRRNTATAHPTQAPRRASQRCCCRRCCSVPSSSPSSSSWPAYAIRKPCFVRCAPFICRSRGTITSRSTAVRVSCAYIFC